MNRFKRKHVILFVVIFLLAFLGWWAWTFIALPESGIESLQAPPPPGAAGDVPPAPTAPSTP